MRVLVLFEESGYIRSEFTRAGADAVSVDLLPAADGSHHHYEMDAEQMLRVDDNEWSLILAHPVCRFMCVSGNGTWANTPERDEAVARTQHYWKLATAICDRVCFEQPVSVLELPGSNRQVVHPWMFHTAQRKSTVLHTTGLPPLKPWVTTPPDILHSVVHHMSPGPDRSRERGYLRWLAQPVVEQWGSLKVSG